MTQEEKQKLKGFVDYYISAFNEINNLESELKAIGKKKEELKEKIKSTKSEEESFMELLKEKYGEDSINPMHLINELGYSPSDFIRAK